MIVCRLGLRHRRSNRRRLISSLDRFTFGQAAWTFSCGYHFRVATSLSLLKDLVLLGPTAIHLTVSRFLSDLSDKLFVHMKNTK